MLAADWCGLAEAAQDGTGGHGRFLQASATILSRKASISKQVDPASRALQAHTRTSCLHPPGRSLSCEEPSTRRMPTSRVVTVTMRFRSCRMASRGRPCHPLAFCPLCVIFSGSAMNLHPRDFGCYLCAYAVFAFWYMSALDDSVVSCTKHHSWLGPRVPWARATSYTIHADRAVWPPTRPLASTQFANKPTLREMMQRATVGTIYLHSELQSPAGLRLLPLKSRLDRGSRWCTHTTCTACHSTLQQGTH
jgi:hypothetical protein